MKAVICQEPDKLVLKEIDRPVPAPHEALVRVRRVGVCGTDLHAFKGRQPFFTYPRILGHELAGEIESIPEGNHGLKKGDPIAVAPYLECGQCIACRAGRTNCCVNLNVIGVHSEGGAGHRRRAHRTGGPANGQGSRRPYNRHGYQRAQARVLQNKTRY